MNDYIDLPGIRQEKERVKAQIDQIRTTYLILLSYPEGDNPLARELYKVKERLELKLIELDLEEMVLVIEEGYEGTSYFENYLETLNFIKNRLLHNEE